MKASFSHFFLAGSVNSWLQEFAMGFPFDIYDIHYKHVLAFPVVQVSLFHVLFASNQNSANICTGQCPRGTVADSLGEKNRKKRGRREIKKRPVERTLEAKGVIEMVWKQLTASCCLRSAFVFNVLNSVTTLFIQFCEPDSALKVPDTCLSILPAKASIMEMKPYYKKAQLTRMG